ncbi:MAG: Ig-like domain-containing protein [Gemmataceae bacterium]
MWQTQHANSTWDLYAKVFDPALTPLTGDVLVTPASEPYHPWSGGSFALGPDGSFIASWSNWGGDGDGWGVSARVFLADWCEVAPLIRVSAVDPTAAFWRERVVDTSYNLLTTYSGSTTGAYVFTRTGDVSKSLTVTYTMSGDAVPGQDYEPLTGVVTFAPNEYEKGVIVRARADAPFLGVNRTVQLTVAASPMYSFTGSPANVTIREDNRGTNVYDPQTFTENSTIDPTSVDPDSAELPDESSTGAVILGRAMAGGFTYPINVSYSVGGPATASLDYMALSGTASFGDGIPLVVVPIMPIDDTLLEGNESVTIQVLPGPGYNQPYPNYPAAVTIHDGDPFDNAPTTANDEYEVSWNSRPALLNRLMVDESGVLANDSDPNGDPIVSKVVSGPTHAAFFMLSPCGGFVYVPAQGFVGNDTFTYSASDGIAETTAIVTIHVLDHSPYAFDDHYDGGAHTTIIVDAPGVLGNDMDPDGDIIYALLRTYGTMRTSHGTIDYFYANGSFAWRPDIGFVGTDSFEYYCNDGYFDSSYATIFLTVFPDQGGPQIVFVDNSRQPYNPVADALNVSNFVTTRHLPTHASTAFNTTTGDVENFRIRVIDPALPATVTIQMEVQRKQQNGNWATIIPTRNYQLAFRSNQQNFSGWYLGDFLRLVSDETDDKASGNGPNADPDNQTILVRLGDKIVVKYTTGNNQVVQKEIEVCRPVTEDNNVDNQYYRHDIRELKVNVIVLQAAPNIPAPTQAQILQDLAVADERLAQAGIRLKLVNTITTVSRPAQVSGEFRPTDEQIAALAALKDSDDDSIDIIYVGRVLTRKRDGSVVQVPAAAFYRQGNPLPQANWIAMGQGYGGIGRERDPFVLPHEIMHILLNAAHRDQVPLSDPSVSLFTVVDNIGNVVNAAKRIGPNPESEAAKTGQKDTFTIRGTAEHLPH